MRGSRTVIALVVAAGIAGCGSGGGGQAGLTSAQEKSLVAQLEAARGKAAARDLAGTKAAVSRFRVSVTRLRRAAALSDTTARSLRIGAARLVARVEDDNAVPVQPAPTQAPQTTTAPAPAPVPPGQHKKKDEHKKKHDEGKGHKENGD